MPERTTSPDSEAPRQQLRMLFRAYMHAKRKDQPSSGHKAALLTTIPNLIVTYPEDKQLINNALSQYLRIAGPEKTSTMLQACMKELEGRTDVLTDEISNLAQSTWKKGQAHETLELLEGIQSNHKTTNASIIYLRASCMGLRNLATAHDYYSALHTASPDDDELAASFCAFLDEHRLTDRLIEVIEEQHARYPDDHIYFEALCDKLLKHERFERGLEVAQAMAAKEPAYANAVLACGSFHECLNHDQLAEESYKRVIALNPADFRPYAELAGLKSVIGQYELAMAYAGKCQSLGMPAHMATYLKASILFIKGDMLGAADLCAGVVTPERRSLVALFMACAPRGDRRVEMLRRAMNPEAFEKARIRAAEMGQHRVDKRFVPAYEREVLSGLRQSSGFWGIAHAYAPIPNIVRMT